MKDARNLTQFEAQGNVPFEQQLNSYAAQNREHIQKISSPEHDYAPSGYDLGLFSDTENPDKSKYNELLLADAKKKLCNGDDATVRVYRDKQASVTVYQRSDEGLTALVAVRHSDSSGRMVLTNLRAYRELPFENEPI